MITSEAIPLPTVLRIQFAIGTGLRQGEQWNLELADVIVDGDDPHVVVRYGSNGKPPKKGKIRRVPLFGMAHEAVRQWLENAGWWSGRPWRLEEVREMLGHTSIKGTEGYAHSHPPQSEKSLSPFPSLARD